MAGREPVPVPLRLPARRLLWLRLTRLDVPPLAAARLAGFPEPQAGSAALRVTTGRMVRDPLLRALRSRVGPDRHARTMARRHRKIEELADRLRRGAGAGLTDRELSAIAEWPGVHPSLRRRAKNYVSARKIQRARSALGLTVSAPEFLLR